MIERKISSDIEIKEKYQKVGVVIFVLNKDGEILLLRENTQNTVTGKTPGEYGVVCETSQEAEDWKETVIRGFKEELGIDPEVDDILKIDPKSSFLGETLFVEGVLARALVVYWTKEKDMIFSFVGDGEIEIVGWKHIEDFSSYNLRTGVRNVLQSCLKHNLLQDRLHFSEENLLPLSIQNLELTLSK